MINVKNYFIVNVSNMNGGIEFNAKLVAAGFNYVKHKNYEESYSFIVSMKAWRLLALASKLKLNLRFFDVKTTYLHEDLSQMICLLLLPGFEDEYGKNKFLKLNKSIYVRSTIWT